MWSSRSLSNSGNRYICSKQCTKVKPMAYTLETKTKKLCFKRSKD